MHARVVSFQIQPGKVDEVLRSINDAIPELPDQQGFQEGVLLLDRAGNAGMTITLWHDESSMAKSAPFAQRVFDGLQPHLAAQPERQSYEVSIHRPGRGKRFARATIGRSVPRAAGASSVPSIVEAAAKQPGFAGFLALEDTSDGKMVGISFWDSQEHLETSERAYYTSQVEQSGEAQQGGWQKKLFEVALEI